MQYAIRGVSRYPPVSGRTGPPGSSSSTRSCDILSPGGSAVIVGSKLLPAGSLLPYKYKFVSTYPGVHVHNGWYAAHLLCDSVTDLDNTVVYPGNKADFIS
jgi:hypothetical protein